MQAVILAGGLGTRLRPLTDKLPKSLVPVAGVPLLTHIVRALPMVIDEVVIVHGYLGQLIEGHYGRTFEGRRIHYAQQPTRNGSGGALLAARDAINPAPFMVLHGDNLYGGEDLRLLATHTWAMGVYTMARTKPSMTFSYNKTGQITGNHMVAGDDLRQPVAVCTGSYLLDPTIFDIPPVHVSPTELGLPHMMLATAATRPINAVHFSHWLEVNTLEELRAAETYLHQD